MNGRWTTTRTAARLRATVGLVVGSLTTTLLVVVSVALPAPASAAPGDYGTAAQSFVGFASSTPTATKPESKLWFAHGSWWASMASTATGGYRIHRLDRGSGTWVDTGVGLDPRGATQADVLWNGTHLFVASHPVSSTSTSTSALEPSRLFRYSWDGSAWTPDAGFPVVISGRSSESLTIAQTDSGRIWATWTLNKRVYLAQTSGSADAPTVTFNTSFIPVMNNLTPTESTAATTLSSDDISTVVSADGVTTVAWSNQVTGQTWSARRTDAGSTWTAALVASGPMMSDDHLNLRAIPGDAQGRLVAVLKTSRNDSSVPIQTDPLLLAAVYTPATGTWATATVATVAESATRPMVVVEPGADLVHVFYTGPTTPGDVEYEGTVFRKSSSLSALAFPAEGTPVIRDVANDSMNNATSSKQPATSTSGIVVLAATEVSPRYWYADSGATAPTAPTASFTPSTTEGAAPLGVSFTDTSTGGPTSWSWSFGDGGTSTAQSPSHLYADAGTYTVTLTATNDGGSTSASATVVVTTTTVTAPTASFSSSTTSGTAPVTVSFTDTSTDAPTSWAWNFGDGGTSTVASPSHTFSAAGTYTVTLTASNAGGSTSASTTVVVSEPVVTPPTASFAASTTSGTAPVTVSFTDTSTGSPTSWSWSFGDGGTSANRNPSYTFTAPGTYTVTLTATNSGGSTSASRTIVVSPPVVGGTPVDRVNAGGAAQTGGWFADTAAAPSSWANTVAAKLKLGSTNSAINVSDPSVPVGTPAALFQTYRYDVSGGKDMIWTMPVPRAGTYTVRLYFSENYWTAAGRRAFDVSINGTKVLTRFDIFAAAGGARRGIVRQFTVTTSGPVVISFGRVAGLDNPQVNAIEVLS